MPILQLGDNVIQGVACHLQYKCSLISVIASTPKTRNLCHKECRPYPVAVSLPCGHEAVLAFFEAMSEYECSGRCAGPRGHVCRNLCHEECGPCLVWSEALSLPCGHQVRGRCGEPPLCMEPVPASGSPACSEAVSSTVVL